MTTSFKKLYKLAESKICACGRCGQEVLSANPKTKYINGHSLAHNDNRHKFKAGTKLSQEFTDKAVAAKKRMTLEELYEWREQRGKTLISRICACPDHEEFLTKNSNQQFIHGHNPKGIIHTEEENKRNSESKIGIARSAEERERNRQSTLRQWVINPNMKLPMPNGRGVPTKYNGVQMRSKLEAKVAKKLDFYGVKWEYEPKRFNLGTTTYMPDFYLPEFNIYLEVKPSNNYEKNPTLYKVDLLRQTGKHVTIVTEKDLRVL